MLVKVTRRLRPAGYLLQYSAGVFHISRSRNEQQEILGKDCRREREREEVVGGRERDDR